MWICPRKGSTFALLLLVSCSSANSELPQTDAGSTPEDADGEGLDMDADGQPDAAMDSSDDDVDGQADGGDGEGDGDARDVFGVTELAPTIQGGLEWDSRYWEGDAHTVDFETPDPADPLALANQRGEGEVTVNGDGTLTLTGTEPRIYIGTADDHPWLNVEITVYYQRVEDDDTDYAGLVVGARSGPNGHGIDNCTATTYYARFRNDGNADVEKELEHPESLERDTTPLWDGADPPFQTWIGMKYLVTNVDADEHVHLRVFRDLTEAAEGGSWEPIVDSTDTGGWNPPHSCDYAPDFIITQGGGVVLVRNTGTTGPGALYKWLTIREISAEP
jgi:hypothetical protein